MASCVDPLGTAEAKKLVLPLYDRSPLEDYFNYISTAHVPRNGKLTPKTVAVTPDPQVNAEFETPHEPFDVFSVKPEPLSHFVSWVTSE